MNNKLFKLLKRIKSFRYIFYIGSKYECPCCGGQFRKFLTFGVIPRPNAQCPKCGSVERHRLFWLFYKMKTNLFDAKLTVLHFAPEFIFEKYLRKNSNLTYTTADISQAKADVAMDITDIKFGDNSFDVILCNDVLEHVEDDKKALLELYRVLKKESGWAVLQVPIDINRTTTFEDFAITSHREREKHFGRHDHVRVYGKDYEDRLKAAGFKVDVIDFKNEFSGEEIAKYNLNTDRKIYFCQKK